MLTPLPGVWDGTVPNHNVVGGKLTVIGNAQITFFNDVHRDGAVSVVAAVPEPGSPRVLLGSGRWTAGGAGPDRGL